MNTALGFLTIDSKPVAVAVAAAPALAAGPYLCTLPQMMIPVIPFSRLPPSDASRICCIASALLRASHSGFGSKAFEPNSAANGPDTETETETDTDTETHTGTHTSTHTQTTTDPHTHIHTHTHTQAHTRTHTHTGA